VKKNPNELRKIFSVVQLLTFNLILWSIHVPPEQSYGCSLYQLSWGDKQLVEFFNM